MPEPGQTFTYVSEVLLEDDRVSESTVFGSPCLAIGHKAFVIFYREDLVVRLRSDRARELIDGHEGHKFDPLESGWALEGWVRLVPDYGRHERLWVSLAEEARDYAIATADPSEIRSASVVVDGSEVRAALQAEQGAGPVADVQEPPPGPAAPALPPEPADADPSTSLSLEFTLEELEELAQLAPGIEQGADERVRSALHKVQSSLEGARAVSSVRRQLSESGLDTSHMSDDEVVALGRRISQSSLEVPPELLE